MDPGVAGRLDNSGLQDELSFAVWLILGVVAAWMILADTTWLRQAFALLRWWPHQPTRCSAEQALCSISQILDIAVVAGLLVLGLRMQVKMGRANLDLNSPANRLSADARGRSMDPIAYRSECRCNGETRSHRLPLFGKKSGLVSHQARIRSC